MHVRPPIQSCGTWEIKQVQDINVGLKIIVFVLAVSHEELGWVKYSGSRGLYLEHGDGREQSAVDGL